MSGLQALALQWNAEFERRIEYQYRVPPMPFDTLLDAMAHCRKLQSVLINGVDRRSLGPLPQQWATALTALTSLQIAVSTGTFLSSCIVTKATAYTLDKTVSES